MTSGSITKLLIMFAVPLVIGNLFQQLYNTVDSLVVGNFVGSHALAAVGSTTSIINMIVTFFTGTSVGAGVVISRYYGAHDDEKLHIAVETTMAVTFICGIIFTGLGIFVAPYMLKFMSTPDDVLPSASVYLKIYFSGVFGLLVYNMGSAILRAVGDTKRPLYCLILSGLINAGLNLFLVIVFHLDVAGVAIATVISNVISASMVWYFLMKENGPIRLSFRKLKISKTELKKTLRIGMPAGLQGMVFSLANVCIQSTINSFGSNAVAGSAAALNFEFFSYFMVNAFAQATVTFTSQNYGAGEHERCRKIFHTAMLLSMVSCGCLSMIFVFGRDFFLRLYTTDTAVLGFAMQRLTIVTTLELLTSTYEISAGAMRGRGHSLLPAVITVFGSCVLRLIWISTACRQVHEFWMLMIIYPISWVVTGTAMIIAYARMERKEKLAA